MPPAVRVLGLDHIVLISSDVERSLTFYTQVLGLSGERVEEWRTGEVPFPSVRVDAATLIDLLPGQPTGMNLAHFCLVVEATDLVRLAQDERLAPVRGPVDGLFGARGYAASLYAQDPDGNTVELRAY